MTDHTPPTEIEPTIDNVTPGDIVTIETGPPGEPETVPVPADIIREVESWADETKGRVTFEEDILHRIVRSVREREAGDE